MVSTPSMRVCMPNCLAMFTMELMMARDLGFVSNSRRNTMSIFKTSNT